MPDTPKTEGLYRLDLLIETVESECEPVDGVCHGHDIAPVGGCALLLDLRAIRRLLTRS